MTAEAVFVTGYAVVLLVAAAGLDLYGRQSTSAWASRVFAGYRRAVPDAPEPADPDEWPHSEVRRFHHAISLFVVAVALVFIAVELVRNHRPVEILALAAVGVAHGLLAARLFRRFQRTGRKPNAE